MKYLILILLFFLTIISCQTSYKLDYNGNGKGVIHYVDTFTINRGSSITYTKK